MDEQTEWLENLIFFFSRKRKAYEYNTEAILETSTEEEQVAWSWVTCDDAYHLPFQPASQPSETHPGRTEPRALHHTRATSTRCLVFLLGRHHASYPLPHTFSHFSVLHDLYSI